SGARRPPPPFLSPFPPRGAAPRRGRAAARPRPPLGPRPRAGRVPPGAARLGPVGLPRDAARARQLRPVPRLRRLGAEEHADRVARCHALRAQEGRREPARGAAASHHLRPAPGRPAMKRILLLLVLLAGCATGPAPVDDARKRFDEGRSDEALAIL